MQLHIKGQNLFLAPAVIEWIERRLRFALSRFADRIDRVTVRLADLHGPRGGVDKQCRIVVRLRPGGEVVIEDTATDLETAIDREPTASSGQWPVRSRECARRRTAPPFVATEDQS